MPGLFDQVVGLMTTDEALDALVADVGPVDRIAVRIGSVLAAVAVVCELAERRTAAVEEWLGDEDQAEAARSTQGDVKNYPRLGAAPMGALFADRKDQVQFLIGREARVGNTEAERLLAAATWAALTVLHQRAVEADGVATARSVGSPSGFMDLQAEVDGLSAQGWDRWIDALHGEPPSGENLATTPAREPSRSETGATAAVGQIALGPGALDSHDGRPGPDHGSDESRPATDRARSRARTSSTRWILAGLALVLIAASVVLLRDLVTDKEVTSSPGTPTESRPSGPADTEAEGPKTTADTSDSSTPPQVVPPLSQQGATSDRDLGRVRYELALVDPRGRIDAAGTVKLDLDTDTGEVCFDLAVAGLQSPFPVHIHVGPSGAGSGIVVDFGYLTETQSGCVSSHPADVLSIVRAPASHYIELHDPTTGFSIGSQMGQAETERGSEPDSAGAAGGATTVLSGGQVILRGEVPDQTYRDRLLAHVADLRQQGTKVLDELIVVPGAVPSNHVLVDDPILFAFGSTNPTSGSLPLISQVAQLLRANSGWTATLVGNTDGLGGYVYNLVLSLHRANAVRDSLVAQGVSPDLVTIRGDGPAAPVGDNHTPTGRSQNRRLYFEINTNNT